MAIRELKDQIARLPEQPGVYLYFNADGETIYVGKARALRDRVRNYLGAYGNSPKTDALLDEIVRLEFIVTDSVVEALALENNLIKQRSPKYNILLRDDKSYPYLQLTTGERVPRILVARRVERDGSFYAGPFLPAKFARKTMSLTHRLFGIRSCNEVITGMRSRPCLEYDIKRCIAPCVETICPPEDYDRAVQLTQLFLEGKNDELVRTLEARMQAAAVDERFEEAAQLRDAMRTVQAMQDRQQKMATVELGHRDVFGMKVGPGGAVVQVFQVRHGRVVERIELGSESDAGERDAEVLEAALQQFYEARVAPPEIHLPITPENPDALEAWLAARAGRKVRLVVPQRGEKRGLLDLANRNASLAYQTRMNQDATAQFTALETLQLVLSLPSLPRRIECFDISTLQGSETVASMVVCEDGRMRPREYRKFRIKTSAPLPAPDDFAAMREVVGRRYRALLEDGGPFPDLILIDGGKGQLNVAYDALEQLGLANLVAVGIAKKEELLFTRHDDRPIALGEHDPALLLLKRIRDEAHRFAVTFHRKARAMRDLTSELDHVPGVGPRRRRTLLTRFGSLSGVRRATREELAALVGPKVADAILAFFSSQT
ncbi:MAG: excinuclease ABC subunit UvrC [Acidobacteriaceae bacterium]|jgi:excinuclease ABC subunit C|nr:excinuclease ABC subunit UvrC [Acidobacteriaceae bacterium]